MKYTELEFENKEQVEDYFRKQAEDLSKAYENTLDNIQARFQAELEASRERKKKALKGVPKKLVPGTKKEVRQYFRNQEADLAKAYENRLEDIRIKFVRGLDDNKEAKREALLKLLLKLEKLTG